MNTMSTNQQTEALYEDLLHTIHSDTVSDENIEYLRTNGMSLDHLITLDRVRRENGEQYAAIVSAMNDEIDRKIFATICQQHGRATYTDLENVLNFSIRSIKEHVYSLCEDGHLRRSGRPTLVEFTDKKTALLAEDALNTFYDI